VASELLPGGPMAFFLLGGSPALDRQLFFLFFFLGRSGPTPPSPSPTRKFVLPASGCKPPPPPPPHCGRPGGRFVSPACSWPVEKRALRFPPIIFTPSRLCARAGGGFFEPNLLLVAPLGHTVPQVLSRFSFYRHGVFARLFCFGRLCCALGF